MFIPHAILTGDTIILKKSICRQFYANLKSVKKYYENKLKKKFNLNIKCKFYDKKYIKKKGISSFTGGIDSFYTLLKENDNINTLLYCINYDIKESQDKLLEKQLKTINDVGKLLNKKVIICKTNQRQVLESIKSPANGWAYYIHGVCIFSNAYNLSNEYSNFYFPSSNIIKINNLNKEIEQLWGSSLYLDKYYSSNFFKIINKDITTRLDKIK